MQFVAVGKYAANGAVCFGACYLHCNMLNLQELVDLQEINMSTKTNKGETQQKLLLAAKIDDADTKKSTAFYKQCDSVI